MLPCNQAILEAVMADLRQSVEDHYGDSELAARILVALDDAGIDLDDMRPADIAPVDQLHTRGLAATADLARHIDPAPDMHVLDVGSGLGGPARFLAGAFGSRVTGIDLTQDFCSVAEMLTRRMGLEKLVVFRRGDACAMPFEDESFDAALSQNAIMNIADKKRLFAEVHRVLKPGARFAVSCAVTGPGGPLHLPVEWAADASMEFTVGAEELQGALEGAGFRVVEWTDETEINLEWMRRMAETPRAERPPLNPVTVFGAGLRDNVANIKRNMEEGRIAALLAVVERDG